MNWRQTRPTLWYSNDGYAIAGLGKNNFCVYHKRVSGKGYVRIHAWTVEISSLDKAQALAESHRKELQGYGIQEK